MFVGVDGYAKGWVAVSIDGSGFVEARCFPDFGELASAYRGARVIGVDIPIGFSDEGVRDADQAARAFLKGRASSVFNAPVRQALAAESYKDSNAISLEVCGKGLSRQSYALFEKIREVDTFNGDERVFEVHPEVTFQTMNDGRPLPRKKTWGGLQRRLALLTAAGIELPTTLGGADVVGVDDVVDAAGVAWSARRIGAGTATSFPETARRDELRRGIARSGRSYDEPFELSS